MLLSDALAYAARYSPVTVVDIATFTGARTSGIGSSAKFIEHFTEGYPWAHIDMASMAMTDEDKPAQPKGATGYGVRLFTAFLEGFDVRR